MMAVFAVGRWCRLLRDMILLYRRRRVLFSGGIVSSAFCLLYKLFTLRLTRKQLLGMFNHADSPYIRGLGFMYARYTLPPPDLWDWFKDYLADEEVR